MILRYPNASITRMHDIAIIGGGPAGLYSAYLLAASGFDVVLLEEHRTAGDPVHCTGVLANEAFDEFELPRTTVLNPLSTARFIGPSGAEIEYTTPTTEAVVIDRLAFDQMLHDMAGRAGARVVAGSRVTDVEVHDSHVRVSCGAHTTRARACILACGANYTLQRRLGLGMPGMYLQSAQIEVPVSRLGDVEVHFGQDVAPKGFAWTVPVRRPAGTFARIGLMCETNAREHFARVIERVAPRWGIDRSETLAPRTKMLPLAPIARTYTSRLVAVGDAAGIVKATTGGGIYYSLVSARCAADVLADALRADDLGDDRLAAYQVTWRGALGEELEAQAALRTVADRLDDHDVDQLFELARTDGIMPIVRRTAAFNRHRHLIVSLLSHPPARRVLMRRVLGWGRTA